MASTFQTATEATASAVATKTTYAGSIATIGGWVVSSELIALCGLILALLGFFVNLIFKIREDRRQAEAHRAAMAATDTAKFLYSTAKAMRDYEARHEYSGMPKPPQKPTPPEPVSEEGAK